MRFLDFFTTKTKFLTLMTAFIFCVNIVSCNDDESVIDTNTNTDNNTDNEDQDDVEQTGYLAFPTDVHVRGDKLFVSYYLINSTGDFDTPAEQNASVAVFDYPSLEYVKTIEDSRASNISRYYAYRGLEEDENGDIYTFSPSSLTSGYFPTLPFQNSGILKIASGETEFDTDYYIDFETLSGGYKINDMYYVGNGKAVVRVHQEDEANSAFVWAGYSPTNELSFMTYGVLDLYNKTYTEINGIPANGGGWNAATLIEAGKLYVNVSNAAGASVWIIDPETATAVEGVDIDGNYAKGILKLHDRYFLGIESATDSAVDVITPTASLTEGTASPVNNGVEQPAWMVFIQGVDQIFSAGYTSAPEYFSYEMVDGTLTQGDSFFTEQGVYAATVLDEATMVIVTSARAGFTDKRIHIVNTNSMTVSASTSSSFGNVITSEE